MMTIGLRLGVAALLGSAIISVGLSAFAKEVRYKDYPLDLKDIERISLIGLHGSAKISPSAPGRQPVMHVRKVVADKASAEDAARFEAMSFEVRKEGRTLIIEEHVSEHAPESKSETLMNASGSVPINPTAAVAAGPLDAKASKELAEAWFKPGSPELIFDVEAPAVPIEVSVRNGQILLNQWHQAAALAVVSGAIHSIASEGPLRLQIQRGEVKIEKHQGRVEIDSYNAKINISDIEGDVSLNNFSGDSSLSSVQGAIDLKSAAGPSLISKSSGAIDFITGRGNLNLAGFEGPIRGQADQGLVSATIEGDAEVHIESNQGAVSVKLPSDSGASVKLQSEEGPLSAPDSLHAQAHAKSLNGRLSGDGPKGSVAIKTKTAPVKVRI